MSKDKMRTIKKIIIFIYENAVEYNWEEAN